MVLQCSIGPFFWMRHYFRRENDDYYGRIERIRNCDAAGMLSGASRTDWWIGSFENSTAGTNLRGPNSMMAISLDEH